jgi:hypothetical protein
MMFRLTIIVMLMAFWPVASYAQDPGLQDSVIVLSDSVGGDSVVNLWIIVKTDDSVGSYNIPLTITLIDGEPGYHLREIGYYSTMLLWDMVYDTVILEDRYIHMYGQHDTGGAPNPPLNTGYYYLQCWSLNFEFEPGYWSFIEIDTTDNPAYGSLSFRLTDGITEFTPAFVKGYIYQGIILGNNSEDDMYPTGFSINQNYPNPFNASATIEFTLPEESEIEISVYNILGQKVAVLFEGIEDAGTHSVTWDAGDVPSGVYFARLEGGSETRAVKMLLLR